MSGDESLEARQNNEFEAIQSIYGKDLKDLRNKPAWNQWTPLNLSITLTPQKGNSGTHEIHVKIDLHIQCSRSYPNSVPEIGLKNSKGLSNALVEQLQKELENEAFNLRGEEMIFQLAQYVEQFLHKHNKPSSKSFYDEMLKRQKEKEEKELEAKAREQNRQRQVMIEEVQKRQEILKTESKLWKENRYFSENSTDEEFDTNRRPSFKRSSYSENCENPACVHSQTLKIDFGGREIQRGRCLKHSSSNLVVFGGMDVDSGEIVQISEWTINVRGENEIPVIQRQLSSIEQEFNHLMKLRHSNIAQYQNIKHELAKTKDKFVLYAVHEFIMGANCNTLFVSRNIKVDIDLVKYIAKGVLAALDYLHRNNVVYKNLSDTCVYLSNKGVIVSKYSIHRRISDLIQQSHMNYGKKTDIYNFGVFLISLILGCAVETNEVDIPTSIPSDLYDFLHRCLSKEEKERYTTTQLLNHPFFRKPSVHFPPNNNLEEVAQEDSLPMGQDSAQPPSNSQSRIINEFEFLHHLGKGAFGDVIKVQNKLDGRYYAIKRIKLNPKNRQLNKKIVREVKLLSRLNHENVVRYYNSWIETSTIKNEDTDSSMTTPSDFDANVPRVVKKDEFTLSDNIEDLAPPPKNVEVSVTYDSKSQRVFDSSDEESTDDDGGWPAFSDSDGIEFEHNSSESVSKALSNSSENSEKESSQENNVTLSQFMYIQMEFCEKSTLRSAIDNNLYLDEDRLWRLFREIVEGLVHIHQQGMIHRDLKPVNIFLDSGDHVKIGDFGLATTEFKAKQNEYNSNKSPIESEKENAVDESKTGAIGTALYVAPEISQASKAFYNQKVDIYSLGVILFEMCYKPLVTAMERIKVLTGLRLKEILMPEDFTNRKNEKQQNLIRLLLTHDFSMRPTSLELLQSEYIPPPVLEERELQELIRHTLSNPHLKGYRYLIESCIRQSVAPVQDITYDRDPLSFHTMKPLQIYDYVRQCTVQIFKKHGGQNLATPLLMPKSKYYENVDVCVKLMTNSGNCVSLPHDLRVPFARYIAWNSIQQFRRYSVERVYRERKVFGFHPRELYECAFDIVSPTPGNLMSDAEILYVVYEIINEFPNLKKNSFSIRLNHTSLLKAILLHCGIKQQKHEEVYHLISDIKEGKVPRSQMQTYLISLGLSDNFIHSVTNLISQDVEISKLTNQFQMILKKKSGEASELAKQAVQDLKQIAQNAEAFGIKFEIKVSPSLVYNINQFSGMICQFVCELKKKHKHNSMEVVAAGGRYDAMIANYRNIMLQANMLSKDIKQSAVGVSLSLDKLVQAMQRDSEFNMPDNLDVAVCSIGSKSMLKEKAKILKSLWSAGIRCVLIESTSLEEIHEQVNELKIPHIVILRDNEQGTVRLQSWERDRFQESYIATSKLVPELQRTLKTWQDKNNDVQSFNIARSDSKSHNDSFQETAPNVDILFVTEEKLSSNSRKRYDNQVRSHLESLFKKLSGYVIVLAVSLETNVIRTLSSYLEFDSESRFQKSVGNVIEKHQRHKRYLNDICDEIWEYSSKRTNPIIVLFSITDYFYKVII